MTRKKAERLHQRLSQAYIENDLQYINHHYGSRKQASYELKKLEHFLNYGDFVTFTH